VLSLPIMGRICQGRVALCASESAQWTTGSRANIRVVPTDQDQIDDPTRGIDPGMAVNPGRDCRTDASEGDCGAFFCDHHMVPSEVSKTFGVLSSAGAILWSLQATIMYAEPCFVLITASSSRLDFH
jgi:hypothetical protein